jgi:predicted site-specific integrase-resolvase
MRIEDVISVTEAAKLKGVSRQAILDAVNAGIISVVLTVAGRRLLSRADVIAYQPRDNKLRRPKS